MGSDDGTELTVVNKMNYTRHPPCMVMDIGDPSRANNNVDKTIQFSPLMTTAAFCEPSQYTQAGNYSTTANVLDNKVSGITMTGVHNLKYNYAQPMAVNILFLFCI